MFQIKIFSFTKHPKAEISFYLDELGETLKNKGQVSRNFKTPVKLGSQEDIL